MKKQHWFLVLLIVAMANLGFSQGITGTNECNDPESIAVFAVGPNSAKVSWIPSGSTLFEVEVGSLNFEPGTGQFDLVQEVQADPTSIRLSTLLLGLKPGKKYAVYVRTVCPDHSTTEWIGPVTFKTKRHESGGVIVP